MDERTAAQSAQRSNAQPHRSTADIVIDSLVGAGIDKLYCLPGVQNDPFFDALWHRQSDLKPIHSRHEQGAAYMAMGAALATGKPQACCLVPGVGFLNGATAFATAYSTGAPVMILLSQIPMAQIGRGFGALHEVVDQTGILRSMTKASRRIDSAFEAPNAMQAILSDLVSGRPRPVGVEVPTDVWANAAPTAALAAAEPRVAPVDWALIERAAELLAKAERPLIIVGGGAQGASREVRELSERLQAPVTALRMGLGVMDARHALAAPWAVAHQLWPAADVVLAIGSRMSVPYRGWGTDKKLTIIRIETDAEEIGRIERPTLGIVGDAKANVAALLEVLKPVKQRPMTAELAERKAKFTAAVESELPEQIGWVKALRTALPEDGILVEEMTQIGYASRFAFPVYNPRSYITSGFQGTLGWGVATTVGVKAALPDRPVVSINGDGGFMFTMPELATAVHFKLPIVFVVFNDNAYGNVQRIQKESFNGHVIASDLTNPDFVKLADSFGARAARVTTPAELTAAITAGLGADLPTVIEVPVGAMKAPFQFMNLRRVRGG
ncbi:thiamine pyrophosphate-dependent enzyme [Bradyrhizobium sp. LHD-71]|uniref:thiamine pyrophosphate-dependent enzyme n=1 Tax=Bradyrhizobium sp. LHD-71 TaxID=3072141 RepID=UPI0028109399|nr:thiamine pyrophosphate-dependent enzyme [Bradyrhizobium sp. LHD-71]MDQ8732381.1 thiamine pyrophosphate-binding protein [Bradyrhizobium sp. LHD-71]